MPLYVAFTPEERLIGEAAKNQLAVNQTNTVFDIKRLIGRMFEDTTVHTDVKLFPYKIVNDSSKPYVAVNLKGASGEFAPE